VTGCFQKQHYVDNDPYCSKKKSSAISDNDSSKRRETRVERRSRGGLDDRTHRSGEGVTALTIKTQSHAVSRSLSIFLSLSHTSFLLGQKENMKTS
jgi:hypothetical protein